MPPAQTRPSSSSARRRSARRRRRRSRRPCARRFRSRCVTCLTVNSPVPSQIPWSMVWFRADNPTTNLRITPELLMSGLVACWVTNLDCNVACLTAHSFFSFSAIYSAVNASNLLRTEWWRPANQHAARGPASLRRRSSCHGFCRGTGTCSATSGTRVAAAITGGTLTSLELPPCHEGFVSKRPASLSLSRLRGVAHLAATRGGLRLTGAVIANIMPLLFPCAGCTPAAAPGACGAAAAAAATAATAAAAEPRSPA